MKRFVLIQIETNRDSDLAFALRKEAALVEWGEGMHEIGAVRQIFDRDDEKIGLVTVIDKEQQTQEQLDWQKKQEKEGVPI